MERVMEDLANTPVKLVPCKECGTKVPVNANYPIEEVGCREYYCPKKMTEI